MLKRAELRTGLVDRDGRPLVTMHGLRHTGASLLFADGVPLIVISRHLGHRSPQVTATVYAHLVDTGQLERVVDAFDRLALAGPPAPDPADPAVADGGELVAAG